jgi:hypothetical protein
MRPSLAVRPLLWSFLLLLAVAGPGCSCGGPSQLQQLTLTYINLGTGPVNTAPLWTLRPGQVFDGMRVLEEVEVEGRRVFPVVPMGPPHAFAGYRDYRYFSMSQDGILFHGSLRYGLFTRPVLWIPATVRQGMEWESDPFGNSPAVDGGVGLKVRCKASSAVANYTPYSTDQVVWEIACSDGWFIRETTRYAVGVGPLANNFVLPQDTPTALSPPLPAVQPQALNDGKPLIKDFFAESVSAIVNPARDGTSARLVAKGTVAGFSQGGVEGSPVNAYLPAQASVCGLFDGQGISRPPDMGENNFEQVCPPPAGTAVMPDGSLKYVLARREFYGGAYPGDPTPTTYGPYVPVGVERTPSGEARVFAGTADGLARIHVGEYTNRPAYELGGAKSLGDPFAGILFDQSSQPRHWWLKRDAAGGLALGIPHGDGRVLSAYLEGDHFTRIEPALVPFFVSVKVGADARDYLHVTPAGRVERIHLGAEGMRLEPLAQVTLPKGHWAVGALEHGGKLVVFSQGDYLGWDTQLEGTPGGSKPPSFDLTIPPQLGNIYGWSVPLPTGTTPGPIPAPFRYTAVIPDGTDVKVCWSGREPKDLTGWNLGDAPASGVMTVGESCVLVMRDLQSVSGLWNQSNRSQTAWWRVEGNLPGLGRTLVGVDPTVPYYAHRIWEDLPLAPLKGGGFISREHEYFPGAAVRGPGVAPAGHAPDSAGHGFWALWYPDHDCGQPSPCAEVRRWDREVHVYKYALPASDFPQAVYTRAVQGGGALIGYHFIAPDGTHSAVPAPALPPQDPNYPQKTVVAWGRLADGTACGAIFDRTYPDLTQLYCIAPGGAERRTGNVLVYRTAEWNVTPEGIFYGVEANIPTVLRLDPATMILTRHDLRTFFTTGSTRLVLETTRDAAGRPYAVVNSETAFYGLARLEANGPQKVELPELDGGKLQGPVSVSIDTDVILLVSTPRDRQAIQPFGRVARLPRKGR